MSAPLIARAETKRHVVAGIMALPFSDVLERYTHTDANQLQLGTNRVLRTSYNIFRGELGMSDLLKETSELAGYKTSDTITAKEILKKAKDVAETANAAKKPDDPTILPDIVMRSDANEEADRFNKALHSVIGCKEGVAKAYTSKLGRRITDAVLRTTEDVEKSVYEWKVHTLIAKMHGGAERQRMGDVLKRLLQALNTPFDNQRHYMENVVVLRANLAKLKSSGITVGEDIITTIIIADAEAVEVHSWGREISTTLDRIRDKFAHNHVHDAASVKRIMPELG